MPPDSDLDTVTLGEVNRNVKAMATQVSALSTAIATYPRWPDITRIESNLAKRIESLESWRTWTNCTIIGALLVAGVGALIKLG